MGHTWGFDLASFQAFYTLIAYSMQKWREFLRIVNDQILEVRVYKAWEGHCIVYCMSGEIVSILIL